MQVVPIESNFNLPFQYVNDFVLKVVDMQRAPAFRFEDGFTHIKGAPGLLIRELMRDTEKFQNSASLRQNSNRLWDDSTHKFSFRMVCRSHDFSRGFLEKRLHPLAPDARKGVS
jgi:hypothetical protein